MFIPSLLLSVGNNGGNDVAGGGGGSVGWFRSTLICVLFFPALRDEWYWFLVDFALAPQLALLEFAWC